MMAYVIQKGDALDRAAHLHMLQLAQDLMASLLSFHIHNRPGRTLLRIQPLMIQIDCCLDFRNKIFSNKFQEGRQGIG